MCKVGKWLKIEKVEEVERQQDLSESSDCNSCKCFEQLFNFELYF